MIKGERRWKLANPSLLPRSHYDSKERGKSALWVSAAIWCIHLAAHPTWELSLDGWIYLSHWLGLRWINRLHGGTEMETPWQDHHSHLGFNARTWSKAHQIKPGGKACGCCRPLTQRCQKWSCFIVARKDGQGAIWILKYAPDIKWNCPSFDRQGNTLLSYSKMDSSSWDASWQSSKWICLQTKVGESFWCLKLSTQFGVCMFHQRTL